MLQRYSWLNFSYCSACKLASHFYSLSSDTYRVYKPTNIYYRRACKLVLSPPASQWTEYCPHILFFKKTHYLSALWSLNTDCVTQHKSMQTWNNHVTIYRYEGTTNMIALSKLMQLKNISLLLVHKSKHNPANSQLSSIKSSLHLMSYN
jgi:hypothetical protein